MLGFIFENGSCLDLAGILVQVSVPAGYSGSG